MGRSHEGMLTSRGKWGTKRDSDSPTQNALIKKRGNYGPTEFEEEVERFLSAR